MTKCDAEYKNLNRIKSYSEQAYATVQWAEQVCKNDEYLKQRVEKLSYLTPAAIRKRFSPVLVDEANSYGHQVNKDTVSFSKSTSSEINIDFSDLNQIDTYASNVTFETYYSNGEYHKRAVIPLTDTETQILTCRNFEQGTGINSFWYVGYDHNKQYELRADWIRDHFDHEIPAVCRAQTITIPKDENNQDIINGKLESVDLQIENTGVDCSDWASPLYVQIFRTEERTVEKTTWDPVTLSNKSETPPVYETISWPIGHPHNALATAEFKPWKTSPGFYNFRFDKAVTVNTGDKLALVFSSPLSHKDHSPRIGGWGRNCAQEKYPGGDAFLSEDNARSFMRYGRNNLAVEYKYGQLTPLDFAFQCHIHKYEQEYIKDKDYYLYLKPIMGNLMNKLRLSGSLSGETEQDHESGKYVTFEYNTTGKPTDWTTLPYKTEVSFDSTQIIFIRAKLKTTSTSVTPTIESLNIVTKSDLPNEMYVRTHFYNPKTTPMLGANEWGRIYAPFECTPNDGDIHAELEIIQDRIVTEHFTIITVNELDYYLELRDSEGNPILDSEQIIDVPNDDRAQYLYDNPSVVNKLKNYNIYVKPYTLTIDEEEVTYYLSFDGGLDDDDQQIISGLQFTQNPAYPIKECLIQPQGGDEVVSYGEWYNFTVDYDNHILYLDEDVLTGMAVGSLAVSYNPCFMTGLTAEEMGYGIDEETGEQTEGLALDYFKQHFIVNENEIETRRIQLKAPPVDPIRQVILNKDTDNETELLEDIDFTVDYNTRELIFPILNQSNQTSILQLNDTLDVVYTPNIEDTGIALGYRVVREDTNHECIIKPNFIEYKV